MVVVVEVVVAWVGGVGGGAMVEEVMVVEGVVAAQVEEVEAVRGL